MGSRSSDADFLHFGGPPGLFGEQRPEMPSMIRQNSLGENKMLLAQKEAAGQCDVEFNKHFVQEGIIGNGTFAEVYKVKSLLEDGYFAVKRIRRQFKSRKDREWLLNEVMMMRQVGTTVCPYVIQFVRAWQEDSHFFVQLSLAERGCLKDAVHSLIVKKELVPTTALWHILHDVSAGLKHIHEHGIVHLDVKTANVLIHESGVLQIGDFGMASRIGSTDDSHEGDQRYMAPELLNFSERLPSADVFSLGLTMYELCYSQRQLDSGMIGLPTEGDAWHDLREGKAPPIEHRPQELVDIIIKCMSPEPRDRPTASSICGMKVVMKAKKTTKDTFLTSASMKSLVQHHTILQKTDSFCPIHPLQVDTLSNIDPALAEFLLNRAVTPR